MLCYKYWSWWSGREMLRLDTVATVLCGDEFVGIESKKDQGTISARYPKRRRTKLLKRQY